MKDLASKFQMRELDIPKIHGEVDIRFRNPISGNLVKHIKGENTFQSAVLAKGLRNLGSANSSYYDAISNSEPFKEIVGGIFLFKNSLPSGAQYMAKGNQMTANGSYGVTNNSNPMELGSWNDNESNAGAHAMTLVYDWTTSQGNGQISSVALTSRVGGYIGYGNKSETAATSIKSFAENQSLKAIQGIDSIGYAKKIQTGNKLYQFMYNSADKELTITKSRVPITQGSVFDWLTERDLNVDVSDLHYDFVCGDGFRAWLDGGKIYLTPTFTYARGWAVAGKFYVWEYNPANDELEEIEITNTSGEAITYVASSVSYGRLYTYHHDSNTHVFDISNSNYVGYIENIYGGTAAYPVGSNFVNGLTLIPRNNGNPMCYRIYDPDNRTCYPTNGYFSINYGEGNLYYDPETDTLNVYDRDSAHAINNPLYLATNYNLASAVTKDATMAMQVRYTLTEA